MLLAYRSCKDYEIIEFHLVRFFHWFICKNENKNLHRHKLDCLHLSIFEIHIHIFLYKIFILILLMSKMSFYPTYTTSYIIGHCICLSINLYRYDLQNVAKVYPLWPTILWTTKVSSSRDVISIIFIVTFDCK